MSFQFRSSRIKILLSTLFCSPTYSVQYNMIARQHVNTHMPAGYKQWFQFRTASDHSKQAVSGWSHFFLSSFLILLFIMHRKIDCSTCKHCYYLFTLTGWLCYSNQIHIKMGTEHKGAHGPPLHKLCAGILLSEGKGGRSSLAEETLEPAHKYVNNYYIFVFTVNCLKLFNLDVWWWHFTSWLLYSIF